MTSSAVLIRPVERADLDAVSQLLRATWQATYTDLYGAERVARITSEWHNPAALALGLEREDETFLLAMDPATARVVGTASARRGSQGVVNLMRLYVRPDHHGRGVGSALLKAVLAPYDDCSEVMLEVEERNRNAVQFYQRQGFTQTGRGQDCGGFAEAIPHLIMTRSRAA